MNAELLAQVDALITQRVGEQTLYLALPQVRGFVNQLALACKTWSQPQQYTKPSSPLEDLPHSDRELEKWAEKCLGPGHTAADAEMHVSKAKTASRIGHLSKPAGKLLSVDHGAQHARNCAHGFE